MMRRIYESDAVDNDREDPFRPGQSSEETTPQAARSITSSAWSERLLPEWAAKRAVSVRLSAERTSVATGSPLEFTVTFRNRLPIPVTVTTRSPVVWTWAVDGCVEASRAPAHDPPATTGSFTLSRGERLQFRKEWSGMFRVTETEWEPADPGEYTLRAALNVEDPDGAGLADERTITVE